MLLKNVIKCCINSTKYTHNRLILSSLCETHTIFTLNYMIKKYENLEHYYYGIFFNLVNRRIVANIILKDLIHLIIPWRQIRGYPSYGNTTHTNAKTSRKSKLLLEYRITQFNKLFGVKKRNIYPTLVKAEYNNRLWYHNWKIEWDQANLFAWIMALSKGKENSFNPAILADNQTNGYTRVGKAAKIGKAKKLTKVFTIGVPLFFTRYIYYLNTPRGFPVRLTLKDDVNKKLGKKFKRNKIG